jgi:hypothetical protein
MKRPEKTPDQKILAVCRVFNDIQTGSNPLTPEEVSKLIDNRPLVYGVLRANAG